MHFYLRPTSAPTACSFHVQARIRRNLSLGAVTLEPASEAAGTGSGGRRPAGAAAPRSSEFSLAGSAGGAGGGVDDDDDDDK